MAIYESRRERLRLPTWISRASQARPEFPGAAGILAAAAGVAIAAASVRSVPSTLRGSEGVAFRMPLCSPSPRSAVSSADARSCICHSWQWKDQGATEQVSLVLEGTEPPKAGATAASVA